MSLTRLSSIGGAALALASLGAAYAAQSPPPGPTGPGPQLPEVPSVTLPPAPSPEPSIPLPRPPALAVQAWQAPQVYDSYHVMCERGGATFELGGGLLMLDPDTLQVTSVDRSLQASALGPYLGGADVPDRYEAANCSEDGGRTWGKVLLDFYVPNFGESSGAHTGYESLVLGEQSSAEHSEFPAEDEKDLDAMMEVLAQMLGDSTPAIETPSMPALPSPLYAIELTYLAPQGQYVTISVPGVIGMPSVVPLVNYYSNAAETMVVEIGPSQTVQKDGVVSSSGYQLNIQRVTGPNVTATCTPLDADVKVILHVASPQDPAYPSGGSGTFELGYQTIGTSASGHAPSSFGIKYESSTASTGPSRSDFFVDVTQTPSCNDPGPLNIAGRFQDRADPAKTSDDLDLKLLLKMPQMANWNLVRKTDANERMVITSTATAALGELTVSGVDKGRTLRASLAPLPEKITVCADKGNQCNEPWRLDRNSEASFYITVRDKNAKAARTTASYAESGNGNSTDLVLSLSDLAYDFYVGQFSWKELPGIPFTHGDYPKWFFLDTMGKVLSGYYHSTSGSHHLNIEFPGEKTRAWNREAVLDKKHYGTKVALDFWGDMVCSRGFNVGMDVGGRIAGAILGQAFCHGFAP